MVTIIGWLLMVVGVLAGGAIIYCWLRFMVWCSREGRRDMAVPFAALLAARRRAVAAARHAALEPVRVVSVKTVNERKALP